MCSKLRMALLLLLVASPVSTDNDGLDFSFMKDIVQSFRLVTFKDFSIYFEHLEASL